MPDIQTATLEFHTAFTLLTIANFNSNATISHFISCYAFQYFFFLAPFTKRIKREFHRTTYVVWWFRGVVWWNKPKNCHKEKINQKIATFLHFLFAKWRMGWTIFRIYIRLRYILDNIEFTIRIIVRSLSSIQINI